MEEFSDLHLTLNVKKSYILRFGARYMHNCKEVQFDGGAIQFVDKAKYLGVMWKVGRKFGVDLQYMKSNFYRSFNSVFHRVARFRSEIVILQLVTSFCQPYLLYCTECLGLTTTQIRSINHSDVAAERIRRVRERVKKTLDETLPDPTVRQSTQPKLWQPTVRYTVEHRKS